jgi:hypothetical protein
MSAAAASSSAGSASTQACQACSTSSGWARPAPRKRSRASSRRASWRRYWTRSLTGAAHSASGSSSRGVPPVERASTRAASRPGPGEVPSAACSASWWASRSTARATFGSAQIWPGSAQSKPAASAPSSFRAWRASDWTLYRERAAASGDSEGNRASQADSRLTLRPGLTSTNWHRRRALGRGHVAMLRPPPVTTNRPSKQTSMSRVPERSAAGEATTLTILSAAAARMSARAACRPI